MKGSLAMTTHRAILSTLLVAGAASFGLCGAKPPLAPLPPFARLAPFAKASPIPPLESIKQLPPLPAFSSDATAIPEMPEMPASPETIPRTRWSPDAMPAMPASPETTTIPRARSAPVAVRSPYAALPEHGRMVRVQAPAVRFAASYRAATLASFEIDVTEVTTAEYGACVRAGRCAVPRTGTHCNWGKAARAEHPINCVDWHQAATYCLTQGKRLPTEDEWHYAARGPDVAAHPYPWGTAEPAGRICAGRDTSAEGTCAVGSYASGESPFHVLDMAGNVWEWTASTYCDGCEIDERVIKGGSWSSVDAHPALRASRLPSTTDDDLGFRCVR